MTADEICLAAYPDAEWSRVADESDLFASLFEQPAQSLVRLGDGELNLLRRDDAVARELLRAIHAAGVLGLPEHFNKCPHSWRAALRAELAKSAYRETHVISSVLPLFRPSVIARIARGRRVLWITHNASVIVRRLNHPAFRRFYGFDEDRNDLALDVVRGRTLPYTPDTLATVRETCTAIEAHDFDLAIIGMGAAGKMLVRHIAQEMNRPALDAGCILSAMRGDWGDRLVFQRELKALVWMTRL